MGCGASRSGRLDDSPSVSKAKVELVPPVPAAQVPAAPVPTSATPWVAAPLYIDKGDRTLRFEANAFLHAKRGRDCRRAGART